MGDTDVKTTSGYIAGIAAAAGVWLWAMSLAALNSVAAQDGLAAKDAGGSCSLQENRGFERRSATAHQITTKFVAKPDAHADAGQVKKHILYLHILGRFAFTQLHNSSSTPCSFGTEVDASLDLHFELFNVGNKVHDECSLSRCARFLSELMESVVIGQQEFSNTIDAITNAIRSSDSAYLRYPRLGVPRALQEAYRHIYQVGTNERILVDVSSEDFLNIGFDEFLAWFKHQQNTLRNAKDDKGVPRQSPPPGSPPSKPQAQDTDCPAGSELSLEEINIDHHGWGQRSIIMIKNGYTGSGVAGISNAMLRAFCPPSGKDANNIDAPPWREMVGRVSCYRERIGQDRWLNLFSDQQPAASSSDMWRYAQGIAQALKSDRCVHPELRLVVVNFLQQR